MARQDTHKYFAACLLLFSLTCIHADDIGKSEIDLEMLAARNQLLDTMFNESLKILQYAYDRGDDICKRWLQEQTQTAETSAELEDRENQLKACTRRVVDRLDPTASRREDHPDEIMLRKYGFEDLRKVMNQKYAEFYVEIVRRMDECVKSLTPEQQSKTTAQNLKMWSSKIKDATTLAGKEMAFGRCMRYYYFERGV